jgi:type II secretory pathway pseudopilin PulG
LIEVLVALVLLASAGTGLVTLLGQTAHAMRHTLEAERLTRRAATELDRLVLADRAALVSRTGASTSRDWVITIQPVSPVLFDVRIAESDSGITLLRTTLYRPVPDSSDARP